MNKEIKLICFDLNKTLIKENSWLRLNLAMGVTAKEDEVILNLSREGIFSYREGQDILGRIYKKRGDISKKNIERVLFDYNYFPGVKIVIKYLKDRGYKLALVSGAMDLLVDKVAVELGIDFYKAANRMVFDKNNNLVKIRAKQEEAVAKLSFLNIFCRQEKIKMSECACVGDSENDSQIFKASGHGVAFKGSVAEKYAWKTISNWRDLMSIF